MAENQKTDAKAPAAPANGLKSPTKPAKSKAARVAFADLVVLYERALKTSKHEKKKELLTTFFSKWEGEEYFHLMRLLLPQLDKERQTYGLKETMLAKSYIHLLNISPTSEDALRLLHWRRPAKGVTGEIEGGDFGSAVYQSLENRCGKEGNCSIADINDYLDALNVAADRPAREAILRSMLKRTSANEQKWIVRIILKELKIGMSEKTVFNYFHEDAVDYFNVTSNLRKVCEDLKNPQKKLVHDQVSLFNPVKPMLAARYPPEKVPKLMDNKQFIIETKYDGERIQVHRDGDNIKLFSRNSNDVTGIYGEHLSPVIKELVRATKVILDGEILIWDTIAERFEDFGKLKTFAMGNRNITAPEVGANYGKQLCYIVFDVLFVNDRPVMDLTLDQRMKILERVIPSTRPKTLEIVEQRRAKNVQEVIEALDNAIEARQEGIMVKKVDSIYVPNERKEKWIKIKPEYMDGVGDDMDMIILGGYYGSGVRKGGTISHFLMGVKKSANLFYSVCRVGSGYSDKELKSLQKLLQPYWRDWNPQNPPACMPMQGTFFKEKPDIWIEPKNSKILQIKAAQITVTDKYKSGYTLRFPRVMKIRTDKNWDMCMTIQELIDMATNFEGRYAKRKFSESTGAKDTKSPAKKKKVTSVEIRNPAAVVLPSFRPIDPRTVEVKSDLFKNLEFFVVSGDFKHPKVMLQTLIMMHGGTTIQTPTQRTYCVIAGDETVKVANLKAAGQFDIIHFDWLLDCIKREIIANLEPRYMIYTKPETQEKFKNEIDVYGDSFATDTTPELLQQLLSSMHKKLTVKFKEEETTNIKQTLLARRSTTSLQPQLSSPKSLPAFKSSLTSPVIAGYASVPSQSNSQQTHHDPKQEDEEVDGAPDRWKPFPTEQVRHCEDLVFGKTRWGLFRRCVIYVDRFSDVNNPTTAIEFSNLDMIDALLRFYGATVAEKINDKTTHVIYDPDDQDRLPVITRFVEKLKAKFPTAPVSMCYVITQDWVLETVTQHTELDERDFFNHSSS